MVCARVSQAVLKMAEQLVAGRVVKLEFSVVEEMVSPSVAFAVVYSVGEWDSARAVYWVAGMAAWMVQRLENC
jgi:hypothetical protein